jgi:hypothetical protein
MDSVFLIWDDQRAEHGEGPELVCIYGNQESAEKHVEKENKNFEDECGPYEGPEPFTFEERQVIG